MAQENEASVEEILESIKKVIARDNRSDSQKVRRRRERLPEAAPATPEPAEADEADEVLDLAEMDFAEEVEDDSADTFADDVTPLITERTRGAMQENLAALAMLAEPGAKPQIVRSGETSLEGLTRELLRPMLAEWLDKNLPGMVEKLVQAEIARIAGKRS
jgi:cell pole-organizing protein PopZ